MNSQFRIGQDFNYEGNDYWKWSAWIDGDDQDLDQIKSVTWILHPSFKHQRVKTKERSEKFGLGAAGWGTFLLKAEVSLKDESIQLLRHRLRLEYPSETSPEDSAGDSQNSSATARAPTIYLSYGSSDLRDAAKLRAGLEGIGFNVLDQTQLEVGEPVNEGLARMISKADAVVGLVVADIVNPQVREGLLDSLEKIGVNVLDQTLPESGRRRDEGLAGMISNPDAVVGLTVADIVSPWVRAELASAISLDKPSLALLKDSTFGVKLPDQVGKKKANAKTSSEVVIADWLRANDFKLP